MVKEYFALERLYHLILLDLNTLYATIGVSIQTYDYEDYRKGMAKLENISRLLGIEIGGEANG